MADETTENGSAEESKGGVDLVTILYILGGIPAIVAFVIVLFALTNLAPNIPA